MKRGRRPADRPVSDPGHDSGRDGRIVALVIAATTLIWLGAQWAGPKLGLDPSLAFLFDLAALAGFAWALVVTWRIWQRQRVGNPKPGPRGAASK